MWAQWNSASITLGDAVQVGQVIWFTLINRDLLEMGVRSSGGVYGEYIAENTTVVWSHAISANNSSHTDYITDVGGGYWSYYIDGYAVTWGGSTRHHHQFSNGLNVDYGLSNTQETGDETNYGTNGWDGTFSTGSFTAYVQYLPVGGSGTAWTSWTTLVAYPCYGTPWIDCYDAGNTDGSTPTWSWELFGSS